MPVEHPYLVSFDTAKLSHERVDTLIIGTGVAGMSAALTAARSGSDTLMISKSELADSNTTRAKGGIAAVLDESDSFDSHIQDTITAGDGLCDKNIVREIIENGAEAISFLQANGADFDKSEGRLSLGREGGHSRHRIVHAGGDETGAEISRGLLETCLAQQNLRSYEYTFALDLLTKEGECFGVLVHRDNSLHVIWAKTTILASGGAGQLYRESSNPEVATGDGHAMAIRAGAKMRDLEMVQFHPTLLYVAGLKRQLITEALRGFGAYLRNADGERFMVGQHELAELAPRDVVSRAINLELQETGQAAVFLDVTHLDQSEMAKRFPAFTQSCKDASIDTSTSWVPVRPGPHYMIGGVIAAIDGTTNIERLLAVGEVSSTGLHGANRLASNSLLEGVVCGRAAGEVAIKNNTERQNIAIQNTRQTDASSELNLRDIANAVKGGMWRYMGVERDADGLNDFLRQVRRWRKFVTRQEHHGYLEWQLENMLLVSEAMTISALERNESRGVHFRSDCPENLSGSASHVEFDISQLSNSQ